MLTRRLIIITLFGLLTLPCTAPLRAVPAPGAATSNDGFHAERSIDGVIWFRLAPLPEGKTDVYLPASAGDILSSTNETDDSAAPEDLEEFLAADREALKEELDRMKAMVDSFSPDTPKDLTVLRPTGIGGQSGGPDGAVRELNLEGYSSSVVDEIMNRYKLRVVMREFKSGSRGQTFLSSASRGPADRYFGGRAVPPGVYEVFQLNQETVGLMSRLEEEAIRKRGMEPLKTRVIRIVFGIVNSPGGGYELGVKSLEAERVSP